MPQRDRQAHDREQAQRRVVQAMRNNPALLLFRTFSGCWLRDPQDAASEREPMADHTFYALLERGFLEDAGRWGFSLTYRLSEAGQSAELGAEGYVEAVS